MLPHNLIRNFESVSGWRTLDRYGEENDGHVTVERDPVHRTNEAFLWKADMSHEHLHTMWMGGHWFVRKS